MKERPILFGGEMVRAILEGRKTQTRRVVKPQPPEDFEAPYMGNDGKWHVCDNSPPDILRDFLLICPYGQIGDHLWTRENGWERPERTPRMMREGADTWERYYYDADGLDSQDSEDFKRCGFKRRPSIHMPRWASRIPLEITDVRVERVRDITEDDARAEGCSIPLECGAPCGSRISQFRSLWTKLNERRGFGWATDPWVWVISFRRIK